MLPSGEVTFHIAGVIPFVFVSSVTADELSETLLSGAEVAEAVLLASPVVVVSAVVSAVVVVAAFELLSVCELSGTSPHEQRSAVHIAATVKGSMFYVSFHGFISCLHSCMFQYITHQRNFQVWLQFCNSQALFSLIRFSIVSISMPYCLRIV